MPYIFLLISETSIQGFYPHYELFHLSSIEYLNHDGGTFCQLTKRGYSIERES